MPLSICCVFQSFHVYGTDWCSAFSDFLGFYGMCHRNRTDSESLRRQTLPLFLQQLDGQIWCATLGKACTAAVICIFAEFKWKWPRDLWDLGSMSFDVEVWGCLYVMYLSCEFFFHLFFFGFEVFPDNTRAASGAGSITSFASTLRAPATAATAPATPRLCLESQQISADLS